jgi:hypothetical protein
MNLIWQDVALTFIGFMFAAFLIPMVRDSLRGKFANKITSFTTASGLYVTAAIYSTLGFWLATASATASGTMWLILLLLPYLKR